MQRHIIVTHPRSGSNYLVAALNSHPHLFNYGEILGRWSRKRRRYDKISSDRRSLQWYVEKFYTSRTFFYAAQVTRRRDFFWTGTSDRPKSYRTVASIGIKDFHPLIRQAGLEDFFGNDPDIRVIYLRRRNVLKRYVSWLRFAAGYPRRPHVVHPIRAFSLQKIDVMLSRRRAIARFETARDTFWGTRRALSARS